MRFFDWTYLLTALIWIPVILVWAVYSSRKRDEFFSLFSKSQTVKLFKLSNKPFVIKRILLVASMVFLTIASARPLMGGEEINAESSGIDIAVVFDVSLSMYAEDESGPRYEKGKKMLMDVLFSIAGDRVALIPFAGAAFLQDTPY